ATTLHPRESYRPVRAARCRKKQCYAWRCLGLSKRKHGLVVVGSPALHALRVDVERIDRVARRHEQAVALDAAEADVGAALGQRDEGDRLAGGVEDLHAVLLVVAHAPAAPQVAVDVEAEAVRRTAGLGGEEDAAVGELGAVVGDVEYLDNARVGGGL